MAVNSKAPATGILAEPGRNARVSSETEFQFQSPKYTPVIGSTKNPLPMIFNLNIPNPPPELIMFVNPSDMTINYQRIVSDQLSRGGWIIEHHGEELDRLEFSGSTGGFYTQQTGLCRYTRKDSGAYKNLIELVIFYKNNGLVYSDIDPRRIDLVGSVSLEFDRTTYIGCFDTFSLTEDASAENLLRYSFGFVVRSTGDEPIELGGHTFG